MNSNKKTNAVALLLAVCLLSGCSDPNQAKLVGDWGIQTPEEVLDYLGEDDSNAENDDSSPKMQIQFRANGDLSTITRMGNVAPKPKQGQWQMLSFDPVAQKMVVECTLSGQVSKHEIDFADDDTIRLVPPNMAGLDMELEFFRMK